MKKAIGVLSFFVVLMFFCTGHAEPEEEKSSCFVLPNDLIRIDEEAFANTSVDIVALPEGCQYIGENAFAGAWELTDIYIPSTTEYIADTALPLNTELVIHGVKGSYAQEWAQKHKIPFVIDKIWGLMPDNGRAASISDGRIVFYHHDVDLRRIPRIVPRTTEESRRPQDRPELNPIDYRFP